MLRGKSDLPEGTQLISSQPVIRSKILGWQLQGLTYVIGLLRKSECIFMLNVIAIGVL